MQNLTASQFVHATNEFLHAPINIRAKKLQSCITEYGFEEIDVIEIAQELELNAKNMLSSLNELQFKNIYTMILNNESKQRLCERLDFFYASNETKQAWQYFHDKHTLYVKGIQVKSLDSEFHGIQIATRESLEEIANQGYTGYWKVNPKKLVNNKIQLASMANKGSTPRGYFLNADIVHIECVSTDEGKRHKIQIANAVLRNSGNQNIKFKRNPVTYIN